MLQQYTRKLHLTKRQTKKRFSVECVKMTSKVERNWTNTWGTVHNKLSCLIVLSTWRAGVPEAVNVGLHTRLLQTKIHTAKHRTAKGVLIVAS